MTYLLDANLLIAMGSPGHVHHQRAQRWFSGLSPAESWATCPLTENAFLRILGNPNYTHLAGDTNQVRELFLRMCARPGHQFWSDSVSLREKKTFVHLPGVKGLTDIYLLGLAVKTAEF